MSADDTEASDGAHISAMPSSDTTNERANGRRIQVAETPARRMIGSPWFGRIVCVLLGLGFGVILGSVGDNSRFDTLTDLPTMSQCMTSTLSVLDLKEPPTAVVLREVLEHCYALIRSQGLLKEFTIREVNYLQQYRANAILMWMVVAVTLSGVVLAGIQLMASYRLAAIRKVAGDKNELSVTRDRVVLKSSVTGLFILLISFAFFLVFVMYVYRFQNSEDQSVRAPTQIEVLPPGRLGPPQSEKH